MADESFFPSWMLNNLVSDEAFASAYSAMPATRRAWIKKLIAQLFAMAPPVAANDFQSSTSWTQGFSSARQTKPLECAALFLDSTCISAPMAAAAVLPAITAGARNVCCVRVHDEQQCGEADDVLAAMELCGIEDVFDFEQKDARRFLEHVTINGACAALFLGSGEPLRQLASTAGYVLPHLSVWRPWPTEEVGVWGGDGAQWDYETLCWAHPCHMISVWGAPKKMELPGGCVRVPGRFDKFLAHGYNAVYVTRKRRDAALRQCRLVLGAGQEGCWAWPELGDVVFQRLGLAIGSDTE